MILLSSKGEVCDLVDVSQFQPGRSAFECVAYSAALIKYAGLPGKGATGTALEVSNLAQYQYGRLEGGNGAANTNGMSLETEYALLGAIGLAWTPCAPGMAGVKQSLAEGRPVMLCGAEASFYDVALGDVVPYNWPASGNHCIVATGVTADGNLLVHDCANVDKQGIIRPGPRTYDASRVQIVSATSVSVPVPAPAQRIPAGWHDDGTTLTAPNGVRVVRGFRAYVLAHAWPPENWPLVEEYPTTPLEIANTALGGGTQQLFRYAMLGWNAEHGVLFEWLGAELLETRKQLLSTYQKYKDAQADLAKSASFPQEHAAFEQIKSLVQAIP